MEKVIIVMGTSSSGKTHFIKEKFPEYKHFAVGEYQRKLREEKGNPKSIEHRSYYELLYKANEMILEDVVQALVNGEKVVMEHTLFKAKRRITYLEAFRKVTDAPVDIYVILPSDERLKGNIELHKSEKSFNSLKNEMNDIEFPNPVEGFDNIYEVVDGVVKSRVEQLDENLIEKAKDELCKEAKKRKAEQEKKEEYMRMIKELEHRKFWHYCESCGKKKFMTAEEAFNEGWDYPPRMGNFGVPGQRNCGECSLVDSLFFKMVIGEKFVWDLTENEQRTWKRILNEPYSLLEEEIEM